MRPIPVKYNRHYTLKGYRKLTKKELKEVRKKVKKDFKDLDPYLITITWLGGSESKPFFRFTVKHNEPKKIYISGGSITIKESKK